MMDRLKKRRILLAIIVCSVMVLLLLAWQIERARPPLIMIAISTSMVLGMQAILRVKKRAFGCADISADLIWCGGAFIISILLFLVTASLTNRLGFKGLVPLGLVALGMGAWYWRARSEADSVMGRYAEERRSEFERCFSMLDIDPSNAAAHERLGELYRCDQELEKSLRHYEEVSRLAPSVKNRYMVEDIRREIAVRGENDPQSRICKP